MKIAYINVRIHLSVTLNAVGVSDIKKQQNKSNINLIYIRYLGKFLTPNSLAFLLLNKAKI